MRQTAQEQLQIEANGHMRSMHYLMKFAQDEQKGMPDYTKLMLNFARHEGALRALRRAADIIGVEIESNYKVYSHNHAEELK